MKYVLIPVIALGLTLSLIAGLEYNCQGQEMFPVYYGSPFVFKQESLASSMEYFYSISGLLLNISVWSILITALRYGSLKLIEVSKIKKTLTSVYFGIIGMLLMFAFLNIYISFLGIGRGFDENSNYWYWNLGKEAKNWGMQCEGEWKTWNSYYK
jgi:hypothetical protein